MAHLQLKIKQLQLLRFLNINHQVPIVQKLEPLQFNVAEGLKKDLVAKIELRVHLEGVIPTSMFKVLSFAKFSSKEIVMLNESMLRSSVLSELIKTIIVFLIFQIPSAFSQDKLSERDYAVYIQSLIGGQLEVSIKSGRIDLMTDEYAFEIERASKWKEAIGQSIWYALNTNKKPAIILLVLDKDDYKYVVQLSTALEYSELADNIDVLVFPNDFKELMK